MPSLLLALVLINAPVDGPASPAPPLAIVHVTVVDTTGGPSLPGRTVLVRDGKVTAVAPDAEAPPIPEGATVVDGSGKYLIPGLWDMHVHLTRESALKLNLANGVTGVRVMWGNPSAFGPAVPHSTWRREIEAGKRLGPRLVIASNILDGPKPIWPGSVAVKDAESGRAAVRAAKTAGADFVKVYSLLSPEGFRAIAEECKAQGIPFAGHVPSLVSAREASDLGMRSMEHLYGLRAACSPREAESIERRKAILDAAKGDWNAARPKFEPLDARLRETYSDDLAAVFFARLKANGTAQCPTLTVLRALGSLDDPKFVDDPRIRYVDPFTRMFWNPKADFRLRSMKPEDFAAQRKAFERAVELVGSLNRAGVTILAGTDEANPYIFPGFSLHDELALLVKAGLTPLQALQAATIVPARFLGRESSLGSVEPGKEADLVLLDSDPLADVANTTKIRAVVSRGRLLDRASLDAILKSTEYAMPQKPAEAKKAENP
jgi:imidazolonepropionase-like amidohydrolase